MRLRRPQLAVALAVLLAASSPLAGQTTGLAIKALDQRGRVLPGIRFAFGGVESLPTTDAGVTGLAVPEMAAGEAVKLDLPRGLAEEWLLVDSTVHAPAGPKEGPPRTAESRVRTAPESSPRRATMLTWEPPWMVGSGSRMAHWSGKLEEST